MAAPGGPPYYPPTQPPQAPPAPPPGYAYAPPGYAPPPGYAVAVQKMKPKHLGLASGCTIAVGALSLVTGLFVLLAGVFVASFFNAFNVPWLGNGVGGLLLVIALFPLVFGALAIAAGVGLTRGTSWTLAIVVNVLAVLFSLPALAAGGFGLLTGALAGVALWALFQTETKAFFGH